MNANVVEEMVVENIVYGCVYDIADTATDYV